MHYSQKYCLVSLIKPLAIGTEFDMTDWPLHVTLANVVEIERAKTDIDRKLKELFAVQPVVTTIAGEDASFGTTRVVLLEPNDGLISLHNRLIDLLEANGAVFNSPEYMRAGFVPHCTVQKSGRLHEGDRVTIDKITLVDMFPDQNWQRRKVLNIFTLQESKP